MAATEIISIVLGVLTVAACFVGYYFYVRAKITKAAAGAVDVAENEDKSGQEKMQIAVDQLCALIPVFLKPILTRAVVQGIVQAAFDKIEAYAKKQVAKKQATD